MMKPPTAKPPLWSRGFVMVVFVNLLLSFSHQMFPSTQPLYIKGLGAPDSVIGWLTGITTVATLVTRPLTGVVLERFNRKMVYVFGLAMVAVTTLSYYFFPMVGVILGIRFLQGMAWGFTNTASVTAATDMIPRRRFGEGLGIFGLSTSFPLAVAPGISLAVYNGFGMQTLVVTATCLAVGAFALSLPMRMPNTIAPAKTGGDTKQRAFPFEKAAVWPGALMGCVLLPYGAVSTFIALYASGRGIGNVGAFFLVYAGCVLVTRPLAGRLADRIGFGTAVPFGLGLQLAALLLLPAVQSPQLFLVSAALYGVSYGVVEPNLHALAVTRAPKGRSGAANATFSTGVDLGIGLGAVLAGIAAGAIGYEKTFLVLAVYPLVTGALYGVYKRQEA